PEADFAGSLCFLVKAGHLGITANGTSLLWSPYRYFSIALTTITAPQHASFFIVCSLSAVLLYRSGLIGMSDPRKNAVVPGLIFIAIAGVIEPILFVLAAVPIGGGAAFFFCRGAVGELLNVRRSRAGRVWGAGLLPYLFF